MLLTWTVLHPAVPVASAPWVPVGATWWQAGRSSPGRAQPPEPDGRWWSVVATWEDEPAARVGPPTTDGVECWHAVLRPTSAHGDLVLAGGARPFAGLGTGRGAGGPAALVTVAGDSPDDGREREFFRRFMHVSRDVGRAPGHLVSLVHAPTGEASTGPVLTLSVWEDEAAGLDWAYSASTPHVAAVSRQRTHGLVRSSGSVRCGVVSSRGVLAGAGDPLAYVTSAPGTT